MPDRDFAGGGVWYNIRKLVDEMDWSHFIDHWSTYFFNKGVMSSD